MSAVPSLIAALNRRCRYEPIDVKESPNQLRIAGRVLDDALNRNKENWLILMKFVLRASANRPWTVDFSKHYFNKGDRLLFEWRIILQGEKVAQYYSEFERIVGQSPQTARVEVREMPLAGASRDRNNTAGGKRGAGLTDKLMVGPLAVMNRNRGG